MQRTLKGAQVGAKYGKYIGGTVGGIGGMIAGLPVLAVGELISVPLGLLVGTAVGGVTGAGVGAVCSATYSAIYSEIKKRKRRKIIEAKILECAIDDRFDEIIGGLFTEPSMYQLLENLHYTNNKNTINKICHVYFKLLKKQAMTDAIDIPQALDELANTPAIKDIYKSCKLGALGFFEEKDVKNDIDEEWNYDGKPAKFT